MRARRRRRAGIGIGIGIGGLVAGAAATAVVIGSVLTPPAAPAASAAEVLNEAADVTIHAIEATLTAGQYLKIEVTGETLGYWNVAASHGGERPGSGNRVLPGHLSAALCRDASRSCCPSGLAARTLGNVR